VLAGAGLAILALGACQAPGAVPPPDPARIGLQPGDLPPDLKRCPASGDVDAYLRFLQSRNPQSHDELAAAWRDARSYGGQQAAVAVYADQAPACLARLGIGAGATVTSVVVRFRDEGSARSAFQRGMLGFTTPSEDEEVDGLTRGAATGLGREAWVLQRSVAGRLLIVGLWERGTVTVMYLAVDEDPLHANQAMAAIDGRIP